MITINIDLESAQEVKTLILYDHNLTSNATITLYGISGETFIALSQTSREWRGMAAAPNGNVYACDYTGDIYMQTAGVGDFIALSQTSRDWHGMAAAPNGNVYNSVFNGDIYMQTAGVGDFIALSQTSREWRGMAAAPNGNVYNSVRNGDIYMQTAGAGDFIALSQTSRDWRGMAAAPNGNVYTSVANGDIYMQTAGAGDFIALSQTSREWQNMAAAPNGNVYTSVYNGDIYKTNNIIESVSWAADKILYYLLVATTQRYFHIQITDAANPDGHIEIGEIFLGSYMELSKTYSLGFSKGFELLYDSNRTPYGVVKKRFYNRQRSFAYNFNLLITADITLLEAMIDSIASRSTGQLKPFWFNDNAVITAQTWMVDISAIPEDHRVLEYYRTSLKLIEVMRSI